MKTCMIFAMKDDGPYIAQVTSVEFPLGDMVNFGRVVSLERL